METSTPLPDGPLLNYLPQVQDNLARLAAQLEKLPAVGGRGFVGFWRWTSLALDQNAQPRALLEHGPTLAAQAGNTPLVFEFTQTQWGVLEERLAPPCDRIPPELQSYLRAAAMHGAVEVFDAYWSESLALLPDSTVTPNARKEQAYLSHDPLVGVNFIYQHADSGAACGTCFAPESAWRRWLWQLPTSALTSRQAPMSQTQLGLLQRFNVSVALTIGRVHLSAIILRSMEVGDLLRLNGILAKDAEAAGGSHGTRKLLLRWGRLTAAACLDHFGDLILTEPFTENSQAQIPLSEEMSAFDGIGHAQTSIQQDGASSLTADRMVRAAPDCLVEIQIAQLSLPLDKLLHLTPGEVLHLHNPVDRAQVQLVCANKHVAQGRLAVVGGDLAVIITEVGSS